MSNMEMSLTFGIVAGDLLFIFVAVLGLTALASSIDGLLVALKYGGGLYLIRLGVRFWRPGPAQTPSGASSTKMSSSFLAGLCRSFCRNGT